MTEHRKIGDILSLAPAAKTATGLPKLWTADLDLTTLPARLDDKMLATVREIASSPLPDLPACPDRHFGQCLRVMQAVLPKRVSDDLSGELFVSAYQRQLGHFPQEAISYLADQVTARCKWFPTIAECLEILADWRRNDAAVQRRELAQRIARREAYARRNEQPSPAIAAPPITQADVDQMDETMRNIGLNCGALVHDTDGNVVPAV